MGVTVSHDDVVIMEVKEKVIVWREIGRKPGDSGENVNVVTVDGDIVDGGS